MGLAVVILLLNMPQPQHQNRQHGEQRGQRDDAEAGITGIAIADNAADPNAQRQHQRYGDRPGGDGTAVPGQAQHRLQGIVMMRVERERA